MFELQSISWPDALSQNSWGGKFHMEMKMWHTAHFALWGRPQLLGHTNLWYIAALQNATWYAGIQGYGGARWGKESGPQFNREISSNLRTTCGGGLNLVWNQPHAIFLAESGSGLRNVWAGCLTKQIAARCVIPPWDLRNLRSWKDEMLPWVRRNPSASKSHKIRNPGWNTAPPTATNSELTCCECQPTFKTY